MWGVPFIDPLSDGRYRACGPSRRIVIGEADGAEEAIALVLAGLPAGADQRSPAPLTIGRGCGCQGSLSTAHQCHRCAIAAETAPRNRRPCNAPLRSAPCLRSVNSAVVRPL
ncbi:DUF6193 family natural product biosynthesis protein [Streptomyces sp. NPDC002004]